MNKDKSNTSIAATFLAGTMLAFVLVVSGANMCDTFIKIMDWLLAAIILASMILMVKERK